MKETWLGKNKKAIAPLRVSSSGQEGNTSWLTQKHECEEYCRRHGLELIETVPIVETARTSELRVKYKSAISKALKEGIQHVLFHKYDREARNLTDNENNEILVRAGKIVIHYVADGKVLYKNSPDTDFLMRDYHAVQNKHYSRDLSTKVRKATRAKAETGWWPGCRPPDGYINQKLKTDKGFEQRRGTIIVLDSNEQTVRRVRREFEIRAQTPTPSWREVRNQIIREGLIPSDLIKKYYAGSIERRLKNIFYDSRFEWNGIEYKGKHERIISSDLFWKVQETLGIKNPYRTNSSGLFGHGWIKCADPACDCVITFDPKTKKIKTTGEIKTYRYYRCSNGKHVHQKLQNVSEESLMNQLGGAVKEISIRDDFRNELLRAVNETLAAARLAVKDDLEKYTAALAMVDEKENKAYDLFATGSIDLDIYNIQRKRLQDERRQFSNLMKQAQLKINESAVETVGSIIELANNAESLWIHMSIEERRELLDRLLSNRWLDGLTVRYEIVKPLRTLSEMKQDQNWRRVRDSNPRAPRGAASFQDWCIQPLYQLSVVRFIGTQELVQRILEFF